VAELLRVEKLCAGYGEAVILDEISFGLEQADSLALLGRNGMGKTTLLATLMGATRRHRGKMTYGGGDLASVPPHGRASLGLGWVPQERDIFASLTVEENLTVAARPGPWDLKRVYALFPRLQERRNLSAGFNAAKMAQARSTNAHNVTRRGRIPVTGLKNVRDAVVLPEVAARKFAHEVALS